MPMPPDGCASPSSTMTSTPPASSSRNSAGEGATSMISASGASGAGRAPMASRISALVSASWLKTTTFMARSLLFSPGGTTPRPPDVAAVGPDRENRGGIRPAHADEERQDFARELRTPANGRAHGSGDGVKAFSFLQRSGRKLGVGCASPTWCRNNDLRGYSIRDRAGTAFPGQPTEPGQRGHHHLVVQRAHVLRCAVRDVLHDSLGR